MATNVTLIKNTLLNKYFVYHGGSVAVHEFTTQNASEFSVVCLASDSGFIIFRQTRGCIFVHQIARDYPPPGSLHCS